MAALRKIHTDAATPLFILSLLLVLPAHLAEVWYTLSRHSWSPVSRRILKNSFYIGPVASTAWTIGCFISRSFGVTSASKGCGDNSMNPDIVGIGVRVALYVPQLLTMLSMVLGQLHTNGPL